MVKAQYQDMGVVLCRERRVCRISFLFEAKRLIETKNFLWTIFGNLGRTQNILINICKLILPYFLVNTHFILNGVLFQMRGNMLIQVVVFWFYKLTCVECYVTKIYRLNEFGWIWVQRKSEVDYSNSLNEWSLY